MDEELFRQTIKRAAHLCGITTHSMADRLQNTPDQVAKIDAVLCKARDDVMSCMKLYEKPQKKAKVKPDEAK